MYCFTLYQNWPIFFFDWPARTRTHAFAFLFYICNTIFFAVFKKFNPDALTYLFPYLFISLCILYALNYLQTRVLFQTNLHFSIGLCVCRCRCVCNEVANHWIKHCDSKSEISLAQQIKNQKQHHNRYAPCTNKFETRYKFVIFTNLLCRANSLWSLRMTENDVT